jgi:hypothetical protein
LLINLGVWELLLAKLIKDSLLLPRPEFENFKEIL